MKPEATAVEHNGGDVFLFCLLRGERADLFRTDYGRFDAFAGTGVGAGGG